MGEQQKSRFSHGMTFRMLEVRKYPLRKIVGTTMVELGRDTFGQTLKIEKELLECGHTGEAIAFLNTDMFSARSANRRRCRQYFLLQKPAKL